MKIVIFEVEDWERAQFEPLAGEHELVFEHEPLTPANAGDHPDADIVSPFVFSRVTEETISAMPRLRLIATRSTGFDHIDVAAAHAAGVKVACVPTYGENTVAEHVFALLLAVSHRIVEAVDRTRRGDFHAVGLQGFDLKGKTMGIIGTGHIGLCTIRIARGFGMEVIAHDIHPNTAEAEALGFSYVSMDELLRRAHVVSLHAPGGPDTANLIGEAEFDKMRTGAVLINTARGNLVDVHALLKALATGKLAGAGLDVLPEEPTIREEAELLRSVYMREHNLDTLLADHVLLHLRNVVITPHSAFNTREAVERILTTTRENIEGFIRGENVNLVG